MNQKLITIIEGTIKLFKQYGLRSISMDEIAGSMGMSKKTLYQFVDNKDDLISRSIEYMIDKNACNENEEDNQANAIDRLINLSKRLIDETMEINPVVLFDLFKYYPSIYRQMFNKKRDLIYADLKDNYNRGLQEGLYRKIDDIELIIKLYIKNMTQLPDAEHIEAPLGRIFQIMLDTHVRSLVNQQGLLYYELRNDRTQTNA